jgi:phosphoribosylamine---glycine ligase
MNVLIVGGRGRECALASAFRAIEGVEKIYVAPGNVGVDKFGIRVPIGPTQIDELARFANSAAIDLTVVGPEIACAMGIADRFATSAKRIIAVGEYASQLETSRSFGKKLMREAGLETDEWSYFETARGALERLDEYGPPWVIKQDGLAGGKGVTTTTDKAEAQAVIGSYFQAARSGVILCNFVDGFESTFGCLIANGRMVRHWELWDYKRLLDDDRGPLTASMGAVVFPTNELRWLAPVAEHLISEVGIESGFLEIGTIRPRKTDKTLITEFNVHIGEPSVQAIVAADPSFLSSAMVDPSCECQTLETIGIGVVVASREYPTRQVQMIDVRIIPGSHAVIFPGNCEQVVGERLVGRGRICALASCARNKGDAVRQVYECELSGDVTWRKDIGNGPPLTRGARS